MIERSGVYFEKSARAEFAGWSENEGLRLAHGGIDALYHGQTESCGLACTRLSEGHEVVVARQQYGYHFLLHGHRSLEAHFGYATQEVVAYA